MHRTQLFLDDLQYHDLQEIAHKKRQSLGRVVREAVAEYLVHRKSKKDPFLDVIGLFKGPKDNVSERVKDVLYGRPK